MAEKESDLGQGLEVDDLVATGLELSPGCGLVWRWVPVSLPEPVLRLDTGPLPAGPPAGGVGRETCTHRETRVVGAPAGTPVPPPSELTASAQPLLSPGLREQPSEVALEVSFLTAELGTAR